MKVGAGENSGSVLINSLMAVVLRAEVSVTEAVSAGHPDRGRGGERCDTDRLRS